MTDTRISQNREGGPKSPASRPRFLPRLYSTISDCWTLTKPEVNFLIALATFTGFYLGNANRPGSFPFSLSINTLVGILLVASGTGTLNQYIERHLDARMRRTARRPLAAGRLGALAGLVLGVHPGGIRQCFAGSLGEFSCKLTSTVYPLFLSTGLHSP